MSALSIQPTFPTFTDIDGQPLDSGYIFIGIANLNPIGNPINVYWDAALTQPAAQPIRTVSGYPSNAGTPARLYVNSDYSIQVQNKNGTVVYSAPTATERYSSLVLTGINAADVQYDPEGIGAVPTTVQAKLRETVSVYDFLTTAEIADVQAETLLFDLTTKIQAAIDSAFNVYFPIGAYKITAPLTLGNNQNVYGDYSSDRGARIFATNCDCFHITAINTKVENIRIYMNTGFWAFTYNKPSGQASSFNNVNNNNYVSGGGAFNLIAFSRSFIQNFNSNSLKKGVWLSNDLSQNVAISDCLFQGNNNPANNVDGDFAVRCDIGAGKKEGINFSNVKFISFFDGIINNDLEFSSFVGCIIDVITRNGYTHGGFNKNIAFTDCYFGQQGFVTFPTSVGYKAFLKFESLPSRQHISNTFTNCYFVSYTAAFGPDILANVRENNDGVAFTLCTDLMSQTAQSVALVDAQQCQIFQNQIFGLTVSSASYSATPAFLFDKSNYVEFNRNGMIQERSSRSEYLSGSGNSGTLTSSIMSVTSSEATKIFKVYLRESTSTFLSTKEYLVTMSYTLDASVNDGIELIATSEVDDGALNRVAPTLTATAATTDKVMTFVWSSFINAEIQIQQIM